MEMTRKTTYLVFIKISGEINDIENTVSELWDAANLARETFFCNVRGQAHGWIDVQAERIDPNKPVQVTLDDLRGIAVP